jgi:PAS domain S-box-containing protein
MTYQFSFLAVLLIINACTAIVLAFFGWSRSLNRGARPFALLMLAVGEWSLTRALEAAVVGDAGRIFWAKCQYFGIATVGLLWLVFAIEFSQKKGWLTTKRLVLLGIIPVVTIGMAFTNDLHGLIWSSIKPGTALGYSLLVYSHGPWFWLAATYNYTVFIIGTVLLLKAFRYYTKLYRLQAFLIVTGALLPVTGNALYLSGLSPLPGLDLTHFGFTAAALIFSFTIFRYRIFDLQSFARDVVVEEMSDGFIVMDEANRIVDLNPAAARLFGSPAFLSLGLSVEQVAVTWSKLTGSLADADRDHTEIIFGDRTFRVSSSPVADRGGHMRGRVLFIVDVTQERETRQIIRKSEERFRDLYENAPSAYFSVGTDGIIQLCNSRAAELLGSARAEVVGRPVSGLYADSPNGRRMAQKIYKDLRTGRTVRDRELEMRRADGSTVWINLTIKPLLDDDGKIVEYRSMVSDITERKRIAHDKEILIHELQQALQDIKTLSGLLPMCSSCRKIRDDNGAWVALEVYVSRHTEADFTHGICPECIKRLYPNVRNKNTP